MKEIIGNLLKKENVRQNLSSLRQEIKDENALAEALKLLAGAACVVYGSRRCKNQKERSASDRRSSYVTAF